jgi:hypothetical protein
MAMPGEVDPGGLALELSPYRPVKTFRLQWEPEEMGLYKHLTATRSLELQAEELLFLEASLMLLVVMPRAVPAAAVAPVVVAAVTAVAPVEMAEAAEARV